MKKEKMNCEKAKNLDALSIAKKLKMKQSRKTNNQVWFYYKNEKTASLKIDLLLNKWYNFSIGKGGNTLDLVIHILNCSVSDALDFLNNESNHFSFHQQPKISTSKNEVKSYSINTVKKLENHALLSYLSSRGISNGIAKKNCLEIHYSIQSKSYFSIAFQNDSKGYEHRNKYIKGSLGKKDITWINNNSDSINIFEGFIDYLSFLEIENSQKKEDYLILNSVSNIEKSVDIIKKHQNICLFLDNDTAGKKSVEYYKKIAPINDCSRLYKNHKDLNEYILSNGVL
jgi:DNA primase